MSRPFPRRAVLASAAVGLLGGVAAAVVGFDLVATALHRSVDVAARRRAADVGWGCALAAAVVGVVHGLGRRSAGAVVAAAWVVLAEVTGAAAAGAAVQVTCGGPSGCDTEGAQAVLLPVVGTGLALALPAALVAWALTWVVSDRVRRRGTTGQAPGWPRRLVLGAVTWVVLLLAWQVVLAADLSRALDASRPSPSWVQQVPVLPGAVGVSAVATVGWGAVLGRARAWHRLSTCTWLGVLALCAQPAAASVLTAVASSDLTTLNLQVLPLAAVPVFAVAAVVAVAGLLALGAVPTALRARRAAAATDPT